MAQPFDVLVIGAGIAGAGVAAELAPSRRVAVLEQESQPGYHSTGRSAAAFAEHHRGDAVRILSRASRAFLDAPPSGFTDVPLLHPRGYLFIAREDQLSALEALHALPAMRTVARRLSPQEACAKVPVLRREYVAGAVLDGSAADIDVHALHQGYLRQARRNGGRVRCDARVTALERRGGAWQVEAGGEVFTAPIVVNAAGAWADHVAALAGVEGIGLRALRRSAGLIDAPATPGVPGWPMTLDVGGGFYFRPDAGCIMVSPADESPSAPGDVVPDDLDLAIAVDRIERATTLDVRRVHGAWAGLRSFVPDRNPVAGFAGRAPGFFWLAGQGGTGIQVAPALSRLAASQLLGREMPSDLRALGLDPGSLSPSRLHP